MASIDDDLRWFFSKKKAKNLSQNRSVTSNRSAIKEQLLSINIKTDPVILKITGHTSPSKNSTKKHLDYLSRETENSLDQDEEIKKYPLYDKYGYQMSGEDIENFANECDFKAKAFNNHKRARSTTNLMITKPHLQSDQEFRDSMSSFLENTFPDNDYVYTFHNDSTKHAHVAISYYDSYGKPLNPRFADIKEWRENFADEVNQGKKKDIVTALSAHAKGKRKINDKRSINSAQEKGMAAELSDEEKRKKKQEERLLIDKKRKALLRLYYYAKEDGDKQLIKHMSDQVKAFDENYQTEFDVKKYTANKSKDKGKGKSR